MNLTEKYLTRADVSAYLRERYGVERTIQTLAAYATRGGGPAYRLVGRKPMYTVADVDAWVSNISSHLVRSTSEYEVAA